MPKLTGKLPAFVEAYVGEARFNATEAARLANYAHPESSSKDNMQHPAVLEAIEERLEEMRAGANEVLSELTYMAFAREDDGWVRPSDKVRALELLAKFHKIYVDRVEHSGDVEYTFNLPDPTNDHDTHEND